MCTSTSVVSTPGNRRCTLAIALPGLHELNLRSIKIQMHSFKIYGIWLQANIHTHVHNAVTLVWGSLSLAPINYNQFATSLIIDCSVV